MTKPEILAPAGSRESAIAAVNCGANAIYLGGKALNARRNAGNFGDDELKDIVAYCHARGVKVYQTINTVIFDDEEDELISAAKTAALAGVDGIIVQDIGVLSALRECVPNIPLFASTQMAVHNLAGAREAEDMGCEMVVLARELTAKEIGRITKNLKHAKTEIFVHGALCMCVSGQCYLSSMLGGRSGNRGLCAQPCRLPFSAGKSSHALSLKDLSLVERVDELCSLGVTSLKIEGRMKRPEYVAAAVTALREALDGNRPDMDALQSIFSRSGFTTGYFDNKRDKFMFGIRQKEDVVAAKTVLDKLSKLAVREMPRVALYGVLTAFEGESISLTVTDGNGNTATVWGDAPLIAENRPTDSDRARQSLCKTGGTPFYFDNIDVNIGDGLLIPASSLNALRREALCEIEAIRSKPREISFNELSKLDSSRRECRTPQFNARCTASQLSKKLVDACDRITIPINDAQKALDMGISPDKIAVEIPRIIFEGEEAIPARLERIKALGITKAWCGNIGAVRLAREAGFEIIGGWSMNIANSRAVKEGQRIGLNECEVSFETSLSRIRRLYSDMPLGMLVYGKLPLMAFRNCPMKAAIGCEKCRQKGYVTDRMGTKFPLSCRDGVTELFNSVPLYLADKMNEMPKVDFFTLWFTDESADECAKIACEYKGLTPPALPDGFTRGLYQRNVK